MKRQRLVSYRSRQFAPNLSVFDRFLFGFWSLFLSPYRILRAAVIIRPSTLLKFHEAQKKAQILPALLVSLKRQSRTKGPSKELIAVIVEMKRRNHHFGSPHIAQQIDKAFGFEIDKGIVGRVLAKRYRPDPDTDGPSWLTFIGHMESLWGVDLFRCKSILPKSRWVLVVIDQFTRRTIGFGVLAGDVDGAAHCRIFNSAISGIGTPKYLSSDNEIRFAPTINAKRISVSSMSRP